MNRSWRNTSGNSPSGFVYFNPNKSFQAPNSQDTESFLSFGSDSSQGGSPQTQSFSPSSFSSPGSHSFNGKSPRNGFGRGQHYSPIGRQGGQSWRQRGGLTSPNERNSNMNNYNNYNHNQTRKNHSRHHHHNNSNRHNFHSQSAHNSSDGSPFYDPTCTQDPWLELEQKWMKEEEERNAQRKAEEAEKQSNIINEDEEQESEESSRSGSDDSDGSDEMEQSFS